MNHSDEMLKQCACTRVRTVARLVTKGYDDMLRPTGLKASQLAVLAAVDSMDAPSIVALSKVLFMDRTTLSRNLRPLIAAGLLAVEEDGRSKVTTVTAKGKTAIQRAFPLWRKAQEDLMRRLGENLLNATEKQLRHLMSG